MQTAFYIVFNLKTVRGFESFARFFVGDNQEFAYQLFDKLKGISVGVNDSVLQMDLMETREGLPVNIQVMGCTLEELAENCKTITKEVFKFFTLHQF